MIDKEFLYYDVLLKLLNIKSRYYTKLYVDNQVILFIIEILLILLGLILSQVFNVSIYFTLISTISNLITLVIFINIYRYEKQYNELSQYIDDIKEELLIIYDYDKLDKEYIDKVFNKILEDIKK